MADDKPGRRNLGGLMGRAAGALEERAGYSVLPTSDVELLEAAWDELRMTNRELDMLGWQVLDYVGGQPNELTTLSRRKMVQKSRYVWMNDPQAGASVSLKNDFTFGRGVPEPTAKDKTVQEVLNDFWSDADNKRALTTYARQITLGTDLALQSNLFLLVFDDGDDGKVKLTILDHDTVENYVRDEENPNRVLYWLVKPKPYKWDFNLDRPDTALTNQLVDKPLYYADWSGLREAEEEYKERSRDKPPPKPPKGRMGKGRVYHIAVNRYSGQIFGVPEMQRTIRWYSAYNDFMKARVDMAQAAAAFIMKRKVKGNASQLARQASKALSRRGDIAGGAESGLVGPPLPGTIINENDSVTHENFNLNSQAANAQADAHMIRAPISASTRFPQAYYGDESNTSLATATSLELPVLKAIEALQEVFEQLFRDMLDRAIERAVEVGAISEERTPEEIATEVAPEEDLALATAAAQLMREMPDVKVLEARFKVVGTKQNGYTLRRTLVYEQPGEDGETVLREAHEDATVDEKETKRDLGYEFSMPSPLRRMMTDLVGACQTIAATLDPNNTNLELTKALATVMFGEALEVADPADLVEKIWPPGYEDPLVAAAKAQAQAPQPQGPNPFGPASTGKPIPHGGDGAYPGGSSGQARLPEELRSGPYDAREGLWDGLDREELDEGLREKSDLVRSRVRSQSEVVGAMFDSDVASVAGAALRRLQLEPAK